MVECITCERTDFKSKRGMRQHHSKVHGESVKGEIVKCSWCGEEKRVMPKRAREQEHFFCERGGECHSKWQSQHIEGKELSDRVEVKCSWCGSSKEVLNSEKSNNNFCDMECRAKWLSNNLSGSNNPNWKGGTETVECVVCGEEKEVIPSRKRNQSRFFCDNNCIGKWLSENNSGKKHPDWRGGISFEPYPAKFDEELKENIRERDDRECQVCGTETSYKLPVRHIDYNKRNCSPENLIALCRACHAKTNSNRRKWQKSLSQMVSV